MTQTSVCLFFYVVDKSKSTYQIATSVLVRSSFLVETADRKACAAIRLAVFRQVTPGYRQIIHNPDTYIHQLCQLQLQLTHFSVLCRDYM